MAQQSHFYFLASALSLTNKLNYGIVIRYLYLHKQRKPILGGIGIRIQDKHGDLSKDLSGPRDSISPLTNLLECGFLSNSNTFCVRLTDPSAHQTRDLFVFQYPQDIPLPMACIG